MDSFHGAHVARPKHEAQQEGQEDVEGKQDAHDFLKQVLDTGDD